MTEAVPCPCEDFEPVDPDDSLCSECTCGHVVEEHGRGIFRQCQIVEIER